MASNKASDNSFADLVARLKDMSNMTPDQERTSLMEAARSEPKVLDDKDVSLADIAKLAGIKEYTEEPKVSPKAEKLVESITQESDITKAIKESCEDQKKGITTFIEIILNQELGEPFRRDAMKKPVKVAGINKADMVPQKNLNG